MKSRARVPRQLTRLEEDLARADAMEDRARHELNTFGTIVSLQIAIILGLVAVLQVQLTEREAWACVAVFVLGLGLLIKKSAGWSFWALRRTRVEHRLERERRTCQVIAPELVPTGGRGRHAMR